MTTFEREYCSTCKHIISRDRVNLSSLEFRRLIHNITDLDELISKNRVSRALLAFGIKTTMKKIALDGGTKNTIMICISKEELLELCRKNSFVPIPQTK